MAATNNKRASLLLSNLSAIDTTLGFNITTLAVPPSAIPSPLFSSATIASTASSGASPVQPLTPLQHPTPRRCSAANSAFMASDAEHAQIRSPPTPPRRPITPLSPAVTRNIRPMSFFSDDSESESGSPLSPYILSPTFQDMVYPAQGLRSRWADLNKPPTPAPVAVAPSAPTPVQKHAIRQWESKVVPRYLPSGPATPTSSCIKSPVEEEIGALSQQITELHAHIAASEQMFKNGMMYVYIHQNAQAAALVHSPNLLQAPWAIESTPEEPLTPEEMVCMEGVKQTLRDRLEKEVNEVERRALRDLEMVRGVRHGLILEAEREAARERRRNLELELQVEMEREKERQQQQLIIQQQQQQDRMDIDTESDKDSGFSETLDAPIILDVKSMTNSPVIAPAEEIVFSFSTEEINAAVAESLTPPPPASTSSPSPSSAPSTDNDSSSSASSSSSRTTSPALSMPPPKTISPKRARAVPAPLKLASRTIGGSAAISVASPMMNIFRSPLSPCFSPCSPALMSARSPTFAAALGSARMSVDFAAGLGFDMSGMNVGNLGNAAICA